MSRWFTIAICGMFAAAGFAQQTPPPKPVPAPTPTETEQLPPEEDISAVKPEQFSFNPVKSKKVLEAGDFYFRKGNFTAAIARYTEATKWNDGNAEAWMKLGLAEEKKEDAKAAREAYGRYLQLAPESKAASEVKKRLEKLGAQ